MYSHCMQKSVQVNDVFTVTQIPLYLSKRLGLGGFRVVPFKLCGGCSADSPVDLGSLLVYYNVHSWRLFSLLAFSFPSIWVSLLLRYEGFMGLFPFPSLASWEAFSYFILPFLPFHTGVKRGGPPGPVHQLTAEYLGP